MRVAILVLIGLTMGGCSTIHVDWEVDPGRVGRPPATWAFEDPPSPQQVGPASPDTDLGARIVAAVGQRLQDRGLRQVPIAEAEVLVRYYAAFEQQIDLRRPEFHHWRRFEEGVALGPGIVAEGSFILEVIDPRAERVVFEGIATRRTERVESLERRIEEVVTRLADAFVDSVRRPAKR